MIWELNGRSSKNNQYRQAFSITKCWSNETVLVFQLNYPDLLWFYVAYFTATNPTSPLLTISSNLNNVTY